MALGHDPVYDAANGAPPCAGLRARGSSLGLVVEGGKDLVGGLFRLVNSQAAEREIDDFTTARSSATSRTIRAVGHETLSRVVDRTMWGVLAVNRA